MICAMRRTREQIDARVEKAQVALNKGVEDKR